MRQPTWCWAEASVRPRRRSRRSAPSTARSIPRPSNPIRASRGRCSTRRRCPNSCTRSVSSGSCNRSWCARCRPPRHGPVRYQIVMGERRWRAAQEAGLATIPAIVRETADDNLLRDALLENIHRVQLNPLEEAAAYQQLLDEFGVTHDELAARIGRSRPLISNMIRLLRLPIAVQRRVAAGVLSAGHARALLSLEAGPGSPGGIGGPHRRRGAVGTGHRGSRHSGQPG